MKIFFVKNVFAKNMFRNTFFDWDLNGNLNEWTYWIEFNLTRIESIWIESIWIELDWIEMTSSSLSVVRRLSSFVCCLTWLFEENIHDSAPDERPPKFNCFSFRKPNTKSPNWQKASGAQNALRPPLCTIRPAPALGGGMALMSLIIHRCVADLHFEDFPNTVLLFELECAHPALRVTENIEMNAK